MDGKSRIRGSSDPINLKITRKIATLCHFMLSMEIMKKKSPSRMDLLSTSNAGEINDAFFSEWIQNIEQPNYLALDVVQPSVIVELQ